MIGSEITEESVYVTIVGHLNLDAELITFADNHLAVGGGLSLSAGMVRLWKSAFADNSVDLTILGLDSSSYAAVAKTSKITVQTESFIS